MRRLLVIGLWFVAALTVWPAAQSATGDFQISTLSARPDFVSGGDVLIRIRVPRAVSLDATRVMLNGADITSVFHRDDPGHGLAGLVTGLKPGSNTVAATAGGRSGNGGGQ